MPHPADSTLTPRDGSRDSVESGDAWVTAPDGTTYWGRYGAAGLLAADPLAGVLLQHRAEWSHHGGTWGIPGGAIHRDESPINGAIREASEEAGVPEGSVDPLALHVLDRGVWQYTTVLARVRRPFHPVVSDAESIELRWVPVEEVKTLPLHPGFAASWPLLCPLLQHPVTVIVDAANVMGARPDGWWKDRLAAAARLRDQIEELRGRGVEPLFAKVTRDEAPGVTRLFPEWIVVTEGIARSLPNGAHVGVVGAPDSGDDAIVREARRAVRRGERTVVVTSDRELQVRVSSVGAIPRKVKHLLKLLPSGNG